MKHKNNSRIPVWIFLTFLFLMTAASLFFPKNSYSESENRFLQQKPVFTWKTLADGSFGTAYETYLSDQFPERNSWIGIKVMAERLRFEQDVNGVYLGRQDYLIERFDTEDIEGSQLDKNLDRLSKFVQSVKEQMGEEHIRVMLVPSASQILTDKLPFMAAPYDQKKVIKRLEAIIGNQVMVPVEAVLKEHQTEDLYYRTDHHWTAKGAYYGYASWAESMGIKPWSPDDFTVSTVSSEFLGTVHSKLNITWKPDDLRLYLPVKEQEYQVFYDGEPQAFDSLYQYEALEGKDKYSIYLDGNHGLTEIRNKSISEDRKDEKLLIIKDSFAHSFTPYAVNHYGTTYMVDLRYFNMNLQEFVGEYGITDVLVLYQIPGFSKEKTVVKMAPFQSAE